MSKEFWEVEIRSEKNKTDFRLYRVYASSIEEAREYATELAKSDGVESPYYYKPELSK